MKAAEIMTREVLTVGPDTSVGEIATLLLDNAITGVPVIDDSGHVVGVVSESDLIGRPLAESRRAWWLRLFAERAVTLEEIAAARQLKARDVMTKPAVTVGEETPLAILATLMRRRRINRVPVLKEGRLVGIVSRADLLYAFTRARELGLAEVNFLPPPTPL
jgi:CBS domain-containing protein